MKNNQSKWLLLSTSSFAVLLCALPSASTQEIEVRASSGRIIGGHKADISDHAHQAAVLIQSSGTIQLCGGAVISSNWILTAAHCLPSASSKGKISVKVNASNFQKDGYWIEVDRYAVHPNFESNTYRNDIALLHSPSILYNSKAVIIDNGALKLSAGLPLKITGWGAISESGRASEYLLVAEVPYVETSVCNQPDSYNGKIDENMLCAGYTDGRSDACQGDSGGPLVASSNDGPVLVGLVSTAEGCGRHLKYGVYTRISAYFGWIRSARN